MIKNLKQYIFLLITAVGIAVVYGFAVGGELSIYFYIIEFAVFFILVAFLNRKNTKIKALEKIIKTAVIIGIAFLVSGSCYYVINEIYGAYITEYDTIVTDSIKGSVYFNDPQG